MVILIELFVALTTGIAVAIVVVHIGLRRWHGGFGFVRDCAEEGTKALFAGATTFALLMIIGSDRSVFGVIITVMMFGVAIFLRRRGLPWLDEMDVLPKDSARPSPTAVMGTAGATGLGFAYVVFMLLRTVSSA